MKPLIVIESLVQRLGIRVVLDRLNLTIAAGEYCVVLGRSGSGKSTLLNAIAGLIVPDAGVIELDGKIITRLQPDRRDVSISFQDDRLYPHWTIRRTLAYSHSRQTCLRSDPDAVNQIAKQFSIVDCLDRRPHQVSGGQLRRAALAKAILRRPALLLLDEPLHGLDASLRDDFIHLLGNLDRDRGEEMRPMAVIHVTHDGDEAMRLADRIAVLQDGSISQFAPPTQVYREPINAVVADALGARPVNRIAMSRFVRIATRWPENWTNRKDPMHDDPVVLIRPEWIRFRSSLDPASMPDQPIVWDVTLISRRFVAGRWECNWTDGDQVWITLTTDCPGEQNETLDSGLTYQLSIDFGNVILC